MAIELTEVERRILANQELILAKLYPEDAKKHYENMRIYQDWFSIRYPQSLDIEKEISEELCKEVQEILWMFIKIKDSIESLSEKDKEGLEISYLEFDGFDHLNDDPYVHYTNFLQSIPSFYLEDAGKNSHSPSSLERYKKMLAYFQDQLSYWRYWDLTRDELQELIKIAKN